MDNTNVSSPHLTRPLTKGEGRGQGSRPGYEACIGCGVCTLSCPVWRQTHDIMLTLCGRARALQGGASPEDLRESLTACVLCGACGPVCSVGIDTVGMTINLRTMLADSGKSPLASRWSPSSSSGLEEQTAGRGRRMFLPGQAMRANNAVFKSVLRALGNDIAVLAAADDISDMTAAIEAGIEAKPEQMTRCLRSMTGAKELIVTEGLLYRCLRQWLPGVRVTGLGEALLRRTAVSLRPADMYIIEARIFHADHSRLVKVYDRLRQETGCVMNMSLQRSAIPTGAASLQNSLNLNTVDAAEQARWILDGRRVERIVVETLDDMKPFKQVSQLPVIHISELDSPKAQV